MKLAQNIIKKIEEQSNINKNYQNVISSRFMDVVCTIHKYFGSEIDWCDFDNGNSSSETNGYFDPENYKNYITYEGSFRHDNDDKMSIIDKDGNELWLLEQFPTRWLFENFDEELDNGRKLYLERKKSKIEKRKNIREVRKSKRIDLCNKIKNKLTSDEINFIITKFSKKEIDILKGN